MNNEQIICDEEEEEECALCLEPLSNNTAYLDQDIIRTPCNHLFHSDCIKEQFNYHQNPTRYQCPVCRTNLLTSIPLDFLCEGLNKDALQLAKKITEEKILDHWPEQEQQAQQAHPQQEQAHQAQQEQVQPQSENIFSKINMCGRQHNLCFNLCLNSCFASRK